MPNAWRDAAPAWFANLKAQLRPQRTVRQDIHFAILAQWLMGEIAISICDVLLWAYVGYATYRNFSPNQSSKADRCGSLLRSATVIKLCKNNEYDKDTCRATAEFPVEYGHQAHSTTQQPAYIISRSFCRACVYQIFEGDSTASHCLQPL